MIERILEILKNNNLFLTGGGGVGKSFATKAVIDRYKSLDKNVIVLGSTGISAVNIGGVTIHSFFSFGICKNADELSGYDKSRSAKRRLADLKEMLPKTDLIVIDEISMVSGALFDMIYFRLSHLGFNGKVMVVGDFYQLPPVAIKNDNSLFSSRYAFSSYSWGLMKFVNVEFITSKRTQDLEFYEILSSLRVGDINPKISSYLGKFLSRNLILDSNKTVLFGRNVDADELNKAMLNRLDLPLEKFIAGYDIHDENLRSERFIKWVENLNVPANFEFKVGAKVIFTANRYKSAFNSVSFYNGEQGIIDSVVKDSGQILAIKIEKSSGELVEITPNSYDLGEFRLKDGEPSYEILASFYQFPLRLAYGITIHKSQGMSIDNLTCNLNNIFAEGQLYVALSRAINPKNLSIIYSRSASFDSYLNKAVKVSNDVKEFYEKETFIYMD